jgi:hypothetical protein
VGKAAAMVGTSSWWVLVCMVVEQNGDVGGRIIRAKLDRLNFFLHESFLIPNLYHIKIHFMVTSMVLI